MTPPEYEKVVAEIIRGILSKGDSLKELPIRYGNKNRLIGASGYKHQIDVSFDPSDKLYIVECKRWKKRIGVAEILVLASRARDIENAYPGKVVTAIIASQVGATKGAMLLAKFFKIEISVAKSEYKFGLRLGRSIFLALKESVTIKENASLVVVP